MRLEQTENSLPGRMQWPDSVAYREAIQSPAVVLGDPVLGGAQVAQNRQGLPLAYTGRFAVVFRLKTAEMADWALRCFTSPADPHGLSRVVRYHILSQRVGPMADVFVPFRFVERGIRLGGHWYPVVAMKWASGTPLGRWVENNVDKPDSLRRLAESLGRLLGRLEEAGVAHGDWQHDNLIVSDDGGSVTLVDYDGLYVPELEGYPSPEIGHPNYQHPARTDRHYGPGLDRFACLVMQTALLAISRQPTLATRFGDGESLLFKASDLRSPGSSRLFTELKAQAELDRDEALADSIARLEDALRAGPDSALLPTISQNPPKPLDLSTIPSPTEWIASQTPPTVGATSTVGGRRWWAETGSASVVAPTFSFGQAQVPLTAGATVAMRSPAQSEARHFWIHRAVTAALVLFLAYRIWGLFAPGPEIAVHVLGLITPLLWLGLAVAGGYSDWPRQRAFADLDGRVRKMREQLESRKAKIDALTASAGGAVALQSVRGTAADYVAEKMARRDINRILQRGDLASALIPVQSAGIKNALELSRRTNIPEVPPHQVNLLQQWCREQEAEFADEYRKIAVQSRTAHAELQRLELERASFEEELEKLDAERALLPAVGIELYVKKLIGLA